MEDVIGAAAKAPGLLDKFIINQETVTIIIINCFGRVIDVFLSRCKDRGWVQIQNDKPAEFKFGRKLLGTTHCWCKLRYNEKEQEFPVYNDGASTHKRKIYKIFNTHVVENYVAVFRWEWELLSLETPDPTSENVQVDGASITNILVELKQAIINRQEDTVQQLVNAGTNLNEKTLVELSMKHPNSKIFDIILQKVGVNFTDSDSGTLLHIAAEKGDLDAAKELIAKCPFLVTAPDKYYQQPVHLAAENGHYEVLDFLLNNKANVYALAKHEDDDEDTPPSNSALHYAACYGHADCVKLLLEHHANINQENKNGLTALHWAAYKGHLEVARLLLEKGANIHAVAENGWTPLHAACWDGRFEVAKFLLEKGINIHAVAENSQTPLHNACENGHSEVARLLVERGANINAVTRDGYTSLHVACFNGHWKVAEFLLKNGANIHAVDKHGQTPLYCACCNGHFKVAKLLLEDGAKIDAVDKDGWTPLHYACWCEHLEVAKLLLEKGANVFIKNKNDKTAWISPSKVTLENSSNPLKLCCHLKNQFSNNFIVPKHKPK